MDREARQSPEPLNEQSRGLKPAWRRFLPLLLLVLLLAGVFLLGLDRFVSFEVLREHREDLAVFVAANTMLAVALFILLYAVATAVSLPGAAILTISSGFLFGTGFGTVYAVIGASLGATALFLAARTALGTTLKTRAGPMMKRMEKGFAEHAFSYLLFLRLVPLFPFWLVNLVPAFLGMRLQTYMLATVIGIVPGAFVYASVGNGLGAVFEAGGVPDLGIIFSSDILIPIIGLAVLALVPVAYRRIKAYRDGRRSGA